MLNDFKLVLIILTFGMLSGCETLERAISPTGLSDVDLNATPLERATKELIATLRAKPSDFEGLARALTPVELGQSQCKQFGKEQAYLALLNSWIKYSHNASTLKADDQDWLKAQSDLVQKLGWMLSHKKELGYE